MKGKRLSVLISGILILSIVLSGCSKDKTMVFDLNAETDKSMGLNISNEIIAELEGNISFSPMYFDENEIYGAYGLLGGTVYPEGTEEYPILGLYKSNYYTLDFNGDINKSNKELLKNFHSIIDGIEVDRFTDRKDNNIYYYNNKSGERRKISEYIDISDKVYKETNEDGFEVISGGLYGFEQLIEGNSDYAYIMDAQRSSGEEEYINKLLRLEIINLKSNEKFIYEGKDMPFLSEVIYSKITNTIYSLDLDGVLYSITLNGGRIEFKEENVIDTKGLYYIMPDAISVNKNGEIVIFNRHGDGDTLAIVYNPKTKVNKYISKNVNEVLSVEKFFPESNKMILTKVNSQNKYDRKIYVGELKEDSIKIYSKLDIEVEENEYCLFISAIESEDGNRLLVEFGIPKREGNELIDSRNVYNLVTIN